MDQDVEQKAKEIERQIVLALKHFNLQPTPKRIKKIAQVIRQNFLNNLSVFHERRTGDILSECPKDIVLQLQYAYKKNKASTRKG